MLVVLEDLRAELGFEIEMRDVDADPAERVQYGLRVPVLVLGEEEICHYFLDLPKLREVLSRFR